MKFLKIKEVAELFRVSEPTIYKWMARNNNPIPVHRNSGTTRFVESEIIEWFKGER